MDCADASRHCPRMSDYGSNEDNEVVLLDTGIHFEQMVDRYGVMTQTRLERDHRSEIIEPLRAHPLKGRAKGKHSSSDSDAASGSGSSDSGIHGTADVEDLLTVIDVGKGLGGKDRNKSSGTEDDMDDEEHRGKTKDKGKAMGKGKGQTCTRILCHQLQVLALN